MCSQHLNTCIPFISVLVLAINVCVILSEAEKSSLLDSTQYKWMERSLVQAFFTWNRRTRRRACRCVFEQHLESELCSCGTVCCLFKRNDSEREGARWRGGGGTQYEAAGADTACDTLRWRARGGRAGKEREGLQGGGCDSEERFLSLRGGFPPSA